MRSALMTGGVVLVLLGITAVSIGVIGHWHPFMLNGRNHAAVIFAGVGLLLLAIGAGLLACLQHAMQPQHESYGQS
jgi:hypothetical protein